MFFLAGFPGAADAGWRRRGLTILAGRGGDSFLRLLIFPATAAVLDARSFALYALLTAALATGQAVVSLGAPRAAIYFHARGERGSLFGWLLFLGFGGGALFLSPLLVAPGLRRLFFPEVPSGWLFLGLAPLPFLLLSDSLSATLLSSGREKLYSLCLWGRTLGSGLVLASSLAVEQRLVWVLAGRLAVHGLATVVLWLASAARPDWPSVPRFAPKALRYGLRVAANGALASLHRRADVFLLSALGRTGEIGPYALAYGVAEAVWIVSDSLEAALFADLTRREHAAARSTAVRALSDYARLSLAVLAVGLVGGELLLRFLFHGRYPGAPLLFPPVLLAAVLLGVARPVSSYFYSQDRTRPLLKCQSAGLGANVLLCLLTIPHWGAMGAALSTLVSYGLVALLLLLSFRAAKRDTDPLPAAP
jgi:O-antigen/teichoic acid export membrane protein